MNYLIWLLLCGGYGGFLWAAKRRHPSAAAVLSFLHGIYLALLCLALLPRAFGEAAFYPAVPMAIGGIIVGFFLERRQIHSLFSALLFAALTAIELLYAGQIAAAPAIALAFFGSIGLYFACAGILPEGIHPAEHIGGALLSGAGFLLGTLYFTIFR